MTDENYTIAVTDEGTIDQIVALFQLLGLTGEEAAARAASGFVNLSQSQQVAANSARIMGAAANAEFQAIGALRDATDQLTTSEQKRNATVDGSARLTTLLAEAQKNGYAAALELKAALDSEGAASAKAAEALTAQGEATEGLSRLQQNLIAREQELSNAFLLTISTSNNYTTAQNNARAALSANTVVTTDAISALNAYERAQVQLGISVQGLYGVYTAQDTLFGAQAAEAAGAARELAALGTTAEATAGTFATLDRAQLAAAASAQADATSFAALANAATERLAATTALTASEDALVSADARAASAIEAFIALQRECNTTTIAGRDAIAAATTAYNTAVDAVGALAVEQEIAASNMGKLADSALKMADGLRSAAAAAVQLDAAEEKATASGAVMSASIERIQVLGKDLYGTFGGLNAIFAGAFAVGELVKASDTFTKIGVSLQTVTHNTQEFNAVYDQLHTISNSTQTSLESNVKLYVQFADATKNAGVSSNDLIKAVGGIDTALKLGNVTGQDAYRVMRSFQEALSTTSGSAERFFQNLQRESPTAYKLFSDAAVKAGVDLNIFGGEGEKTTDKLSKLGDKATQLQSKLDGSGKSASSYASAMKTTADAANKAGVEADKFSSIINNGGKLTDSQREKFDKLNDTIQTNEVRNSAAAASYANAKAKQDDLTKSALNRTNAEIAATQATADGTARIEAFIKTAVQLYTDNGQLATTFTTVSGSIQVLKNNLTDFAGTSATASASMAVLKDVILLAANNLDIIIPLVVGFGAAIAVLKIVETTAKLVELTSKVVQLTGAFVAANLELVVILGSLFLVAAAFQAVYNATHTEKLDLFGLALKGVSAAADGLGTVVQGLSAKITDNAIHTQATSDAHKALQAAQIGAKGSTDDLTKSATAGTDAQNKLAFATTGVGEGFTRLSTSTSQATKDYIAAQKAIKDNQQALIDNAVAAQENQLATDADAASTLAYQQHVDTATKSQNDMNTAVKAAPSLWASLTSAIGDAITALGNYIAKAAEAAASAAKSLFSGGSSTPTTSGIGHARDGGTFTVAGTGPVDSKLIAVSPGEVVTVQTPAQYRAGVTPPMRAGQSHFAIGGVSVGAGVDLGTGVSLAASLPDSPTSVTGFDGGRSSDVGALTTATNANVATTTANTTATNADTTATTSNSDVVTANTTALASVTSSTVANTNATNTASQATTAAANAGTTASNNVISGLRDNSSATKQASEATVTADNDNTRASNENTQSTATNTTALNDNSKNVISAANAIVTSENALQTTLAASANAIVAAANTMANAAKSASTTVTTSSTSPNTYTSTNDNTTTTLDPKNSTVGRYTEDQYQADAKAGTTSADGRTITGASGTIYKAVQSASGQIVGWKTSTGIDVTDYSSGGSSVSNTYSDVISAQYKAQQTATQNALNKAASDITNEMSSYKQINGTPYSMSDSGGVQLTSAVEATKQTAAQLTSEASAIHARDGADFYVPGGTGVDSQQIQLAVSPGEQVTVRTPMQQNTDEPAQAPVTLNMTVLTKDAQSFASSQPQLEAKLVRGLRRVNRR